MKIRVMDELKYWVALNMVLGVGKTLFARLLRHFGLVGNVFRASVRELTQVNGIGEKIAAEILNFDLERNIEREFRLAEKLDLRIVTLASPEYPYLLKLIYDPPPVLYYQGSPLAKYPVAVAVVGTRLATSYGKLVAERICGDLAARGMVIVSGMARGIDTVCHQSTIKAGGQTIAVLGCGLSHTYPPENGRLRQQIAEHGTLVSEFPISMRPDKNNFPARNRVISGLSLGTLIIEAGVKSGALITAQFALDQGREVFAVPGNIYSPKSRGANHLVKLGAKLVDGADAVVEELPDSIRALLKASPIVNEKKTNADSIGLSEKEQNLMSLLALEEKHIETLIENSRLSPAVVSATLTQLELRGLIRQKEGKMFVSNCH
ncbi:MAG: DNA-processing protein DprA [Nitrospinales bacterium]